MIFDSDVQRLISSNSEIRYSHFTITEIRAKRLSTFYDLFVQCYSSNFSVKMRIHRIKKVYNFVFYVTNIAIS